MNESLLKLFNGKDEPDAKTAWDFYERGLQFNRAVNLDDTVKANENFYVGKQWEGVQSNGLPTPQFNILKRVVGFIVASITTDNIRVNASALSNGPDTEGLTDPVTVVNNEFAALMEINDGPALTREFARDAAVRGDGCIYTYWDADEETGQDAKGAIKSEIIGNNRVLFGNPNDRDVQGQPWIQIASREPIRTVAKRAKENGIADWTNIQTDDEQSQAVDGVKRTDDLVTVLLTLWRDDEDGLIHAYESCQGSSIKKAWNLGIKSYPIVWLNWDYVQDCYHGQAMITGLIPNQIFINKTLAMAQLSLMRQGFPKYVYNRTLINHWDNRVGGAIGVAGGDINNVAKAIDPPAISPQIAQFITMTIEETEKSLGATSVALGDTRPDNTSAIIALQRAAATPSEMTKQNLYKAIESLFRIYLEFMAEYYGTRKVDLPPPKELTQAYQFAGMPVPPTVPMDFDFGMLKKIPMRLKLDVGASSYYSEVASLQTLDNLLMNQRISTVQYLERLPDSNIPQRRALIDEIKAQEAAQQQALQTQMPQPGQEGDPNLADNPQMEVPTGGGYGELQRAINRTGSTEGLV